MYPPPPRTALSVIRAPLTGTICLRIMGYLKLGYGSNSKPGGIPQSGVPVWLWQVSVRLWQVSVRLWQGPIRLWQGPIRLWQVHIQALAGSI